MKLNQQLLQINRNGSKVWSKGFTKGEISKKEFKSRTSQLEGKLIKQNLVLFFEG